MPTGVPNSQISDLINHSLAHFQRKGEFEAYFDFQEYPGCDYWFAQDKYVAQSGNRVEWRIMPDPGNGSFRFVNKFEVTPRNYRDVMQKAYAEWCYAECKAVYEARTMKEMRGDAELYDYLQGIYFDAKMDALDGIERSIFGIPTNSADTKTPLGFFYWVNYLNSGTSDYTGQFGGQTAIYGDATTTQSIGGLSTQVWAKHRNWAFNHTGMNMLTIDALRLAMIKTQFKPPRNIKQYYSQPQSRFAIYSSLDYQAEYERLVNAGPDNRNGDLNPFAGSLTFRGADWIGMPVLDGRAYNPICGIDRNNFRPVVMEGWWFNQTEPMNDQDNPHVHTVQWDFQWQYQLRSKRAGCFVGHEAF